MYLLRFDGPHLSFWQDLMDVCNTSLESLGQLLGETLKNVQKMLDGDTEPP